MNNKFIVEHRGTLLGDNYNFIRSNCENISKCGKEDIKIFFRPIFNHISYKIKNIIKYTENNNDTNRWRVLVDLCDYYLNKFGFSGEVEYFIEEYDNKIEELFEFRNSNIVAISRGGVSNNVKGIILGKKKYMTDDFYEPIKNFLLSKNYNLINIDYPMPLIEAENILNKSKFLVGNHSGLTLMAYKCECPCFIYNICNNTAFINSINMHMFISYDEFIDKYKLLMGV